MDTFCTTPSEWQHVKIKLGVIELPPGNDTSKNGDLEIKRYGRPELFSDMYILLNADLILIWPPISKLAVNSHDFDQQCNPNYV